MLSARAAAIVARLGGKVAALIQKVDHENKAWVQSSALPKVARKIAEQKVDEFETQLADFFLAQKKEVMSAIDRADFSKLPIQKADSDDLRDLADMLAQFIFLPTTRDLEHLITLYETFAKSTIAAVAREVGTALKRVSIGEDEPISERAAHWIRDTKIPFARAVQEGTENRIKRILQRALTSGDGSQVAVNDIYQTFLAGKIGEFKTDLKTRIRSSDTFDWRRARTTARTEMMTASNAGVLEGYRQSKVAHYKKWNCASDERSRDSHVEVNGAVALLDEPFVVGGYEMMFPGDRSFGAPAREIINCRCGLSAVPKALANKYTPQVNPYKDDDAETEAWLRRQSESFQRQYLGSEEKQKLFAEGKLGASGMPTRDSQSKKTEEMNK